jgi:hypothetical protein
VIFDTPYYSLIIFCRPKQGEEVAKRCPKCNADNPDTKQFCGDCGTQIGIPNDIAVHNMTVEMPLPKFSPGTSLARRYEIIVEPGKGGMGRVCPVEDSMLEQEFALKLIKREIAEKKQNPDISFIQS